MPLVEFYNSSVDLFLVSCISLLVEPNNGSVDLFLASFISLSYAAGRVLQQFSGFVSSVLYKSLICRW